MAQRRLAAEELVDLGRRVGVKSIETGGAYLLGNALLTCGDLDAADEVYAVGSGLVGVALSDWPLVNFRASRAFAEGRFTEGTALGARAFELGEALADTNEASDSVRIMMSSLERGDHASAKVALDRSAATTFALAGPYGAWFAVETGDLDTGRTELTAWMEHVFELVPPMLRVLSAAVAAFIAARVDAADHASAVAEYLGPFGGELIGTDGWIYGPVDHVLGLCAATRGELDEAVDLLTAGHGLNERLGLHAREVQSGLDLGRVLLERGAAGDRDAGQAHLRHVGDLATELGMTPSARRAESLVQ